MQVKEHILVSMTSWYRRIQNVKRVLDTLLIQTIRPYKIILNLCTEDFPNMEEDLPEDLLTCIKNNSDTIEIYWFIENYKAWKKHLHVLDIATDDDLIISVDDDHLYPTDFIETLYVSYCYYKKQYPVTLNNHMLAHNMWCYNGPGTLYRKRDWGNYKKYLTYDILHNCNDDIFISILFAMNNVLIAPILFQYPLDNTLLFNDNNAWTDRSAPNRNEEDQDKMISDYNVLYKGTYDSIEDTLNKHYFKGEEQRFKPLLWNIVNNCVSYYNNQYNSLPFSLQWSLNKYKENYLRANLYNIDFKSIGLDIPRSSNLSDYIGEDNKLIITLSSWSGRITNVATVLQTILYNTILPTEIIVNLAVEDFATFDEFNNSRNIDVFNESVLPKDLNDLLKISQVPIKIAWQDDASIKSWKKYMYVLDAYNENDVIICIDDDIKYSPVFIETFVKSYNYYNRKYPVSIFSNCFCQGGFAYCGFATLFTPGFFKDFRKYINADILHKFPEDNHLLNILNINNHPILPVFGKNYMFEDIHYNEINSNFGTLVFNDAWWKSYTDLLAESVKIIDNTCSDRKEMSGGWTPNYYNFSVVNLTNFLKDEEYRKDEYPFKYIYDSVKTHIETSPGSNEELTNLSGLIDDVIL